MTGQAITRFEPSATAGAAPPRRRRPRPGDRIGRYTVLEILGRGGMGLVLSAYDPRLDRRVALKLVRGRAEASDREDTHARMIAEARAMARLRHPNVLTVYEVDQDDGRIFIAMEQVEGGSLRERQARLRQQHPAPWRAILDLYLAAGRGLAAAHAAGIVHRDFKPDNVLVDRAGEVRVGDFGLACSAEPSAREARAAGGFGTPRYMASEQYLGGTVDARADQFAFCVALWEALHGELPFAGDDQAGYARAVVAGRIEAPARARGVPDWIRAILERGLEPDPAARYPSMDALLADLGCDDPPSVRGSRTIGMVILTALFTALGGYPAIAGEEGGLGQIAISIAAALIGLLAVAGALRGRQRLTPVNRRLFIMLLTPIVASLAATGGAAVLGLAPHHTCMMLLLLWAAMAASVAASAAVALWPAAAAYAGAFVIGALAPGALHVATAAAHLALMVNAIAIWGGRAAGGKTGSASKLVT